MPALDKLSVMQKLSKYRADREREREREGKTDTLRQFVSGGWKLFHFFSDYIQKTMKLDVDKETIFKIFCKGYINDFSTKIAESKIRMVFIQSFTVV